ncbi:diguanylate cyclase (GGDEF)-like protein [Devosia subaequoris]|uniref:diguanylate cyclase n=1 Tax=Devosia subaequoris TaxID=395930 RepID=A0A7W6IM60_9HYPH|nr:GGDEF domain-containing protein [Devosia subaequoris]MBB4052163.1 diguanylate cyclase (GGDEF)-like protein [Devosia subaequoris]MCP1209327.1 GGDEF domain-containing protein [Devosia subaequoris]
MKRLPINQLENSGASASVDLDASGWDDFTLDQGGAAEAHLTQAALSGTRELMGVALDVLPFALLFHSVQGVLFSNGVANQLLSSAPGGLIGQHLLDFVDAQDSATVSEALNQALARHGQKTSAEALLRMGETERLCRLTIIRLPWPGTPLAQVVLHDITDQKRAEASLRQLTIVDELTGAYNRRHAFYEGSLHAGAFLENGSPFALAALDVDHFKAINDLYGHAGGDLALKRLAATCNGFIPTLRKSDSAMFARIGGEEFVLLMPGMTESCALAECDRLRRQIAQLVVRHGEQHFRMTISIGVAAMTKSDTCFEDLLARADAGLYRAKHEGRNRVVGGLPC